jgi:murein DD-endopeptidase MepM/ murein hydrolase activator NlpD
VPAAVGTVALVVAAAGGVTLITGYAQPAAAHRLAGHGPTAAPQPGPTGGDPAALPPRGGRTADAAPAPKVAPLAARITPDVLVTAQHALAAADVTRIEALAHAASGLELDEAHVHLGSGTTEAIGVDPGTFRPYTPQGTAESDPLWASVARGDVAVAHQVAKALAVPLGGTTTLGTSAPGPVRVGAYATTGLPGVGVVIARAQGRRLGLAPDSGLLLSTPGQDPVVTSAVLTKALGAGFTVIPLRVPLRAGHLEWVAPAFGPISSPFGPRPRPGYPGQFDFHPGLDIAAPRGAPIYAASDGYVQYAGPASGFGNEVILQHADGVTTVYGHMSKILVTSGPVTAGQPIAIVGSEGESTGPHLHFEVHVHDQLVDPLAWLSAHGVRVSR